MRVLMTGATGFIGAALARALLREGHELVCAVREPARLDLGPGRWRALQADLASVPGRTWWASHLAGVDAVVNAVGILREQGGQSFEALHHRAPAELFAACAAAGVPCVIQVSALGADEAAQSRYHLSKKAADDALRALPLRGAVVQPSIVYGAQGASAAMFNTMAAAPMLAFPQRGGMAVQPVHVVDVIDGILALLRSPPAQVETVAFVGPRPMAMRDYLNALRAALGLAGRVHVLPLPTPLFMLGAAVASRLPGSILDSETAGMLLRGNAAPAAGFERVLGHAPRPVSAFIAPGEAPALRSHAVLGLWLPVLRVALALLWIWTAIVLAGAGARDDSLALLGRAGFTANGATLALHGAAGLALLLGVLTLAAPARWRRGVWALQIACIAGGTALVTLVEPGLWLHPFGPVSKNLPLLAAIGLLWSLEPRRVRTGGR